MNIIDSTELCPLSRERIILVLVMCNEQFHFTIIVTTVTL